MPHARRSSAGRYRPIPRRHGIPLSLLIATALLGAAAEGLAQGSAGTRTTPDGKHLLISKDVGAERWAISVDLGDGTVTGNVFSPDGGDPQFVWCERAGDDGSLDPSEGIIQYACRGSDRCAGAPCLASSWVPLGDVNLPGSFLLPATDPFAPLRTPEHYCDDTCHFPEFLQVGEFSYTTETRRCNYLTVRQTTLEPIRPGDTLFVRLWHFALSSPSGGRAYMSVQVGDRRVWEGRLPIPCRGGLVGFVPGGDCLDNPDGVDADPAEFTADFEAPAGTPIYFHVQNHGENSYNLVEISVNGRATIDHDAWQTVSEGLPLDPPAGPLPPLGPDECRPQG
jgi:hypothetical protein